MKALTLTKTKAALAAYDAALGAFREAVGKEPTEVVDALDGAVEAADGAVRAAFAEETADRNQPKNAKLVSPADPWLRRLVERYAP